MNALGLDVGLKRIGVALFTQNVLLPLEPILRKNREQAANELKKLILEHNITLLIVGLPIGGSSEEEMGRRIRHFVSLLDFKGELKFVDESFSSKNALSLTQGKTRKKDGKLDSLAAFLIAKDYLGL